MFPSDLLGNFYLSALDTFLASRGIQSLRYVDDLVLLYQSEHQAKSNLAPLCSFLRGIGLDLNESKSKVVTVHDLVYEQTELDEMFENARVEVIAQMEVQEWEVNYGFRTLGMNSMMTNRKRRTWNCWHCSNYGTNGLKSLIPSVTN